MAKTYYSLNVHISFSVKNRDLLLQAELLERMIHYLVGTINGLVGRSLQVGGVADHVHLLFGMKSSDSVSAMVREIKKASTNWIRQEIPGFSWQAGYAAFSVSPERLDAVSKYIVKQPEHHAKKTYREEWIELLKYARIELDESQFD